MVCPICELKVEEFDEPDEAVRMFCCRCEVMITIHEMTDKEICDE
jgi:hypothetical protein